MSFDIVKFLKEHPYAVSSTTHEKLASGWKPKSLEELGLVPEKVLGQGDYKNYMMEKRRISLKPEPLLPPRNPLLPDNPF